MEKILYLVVPLTIALLILLTGYMANKIQKLEGTMPWPVKLATVVACSFGSAIIVILIMRLL